MRAFVLATLFVASLATGAAAQKSGLVMMPAVRPTETSPLSRMPREAQAWIAAEQARQTDRPGDLVELAYDIETNIGQAIMDIARRERIDTRDIILVVMLDVMRGASQTLNVEVRRLKAASPEHDAELAEKVARKAEVDAKLTEVVRSQTMVSRALAANN